MGGSTFFVPPYADVAGLVGNNTLFGDKITAQRHDLVSCGFMYGLPSQTFQRIQRWDLSGGAGTFNANERVVGGTSGAIGIIEVVASPAKIRALSGAFTSGETITGVGVTATLSGATRVITANVAANGDQVITNSVFSITSGTNATGDNAIESAQTGAYAPGHELGAYFTGAWDTAAVVAGLTQFIGPLCRGGTDGYALGYSGTTFGLVVRKGGVDTFIAQTAWNIDKADGTGTSGFTLNKATLNGFGAKTAYLGIIGALFYVIDRTGKWWPVHFETNINEGLVTIINNPQLTVRMEMVKTAAGATNGTMYSASWNLYTAGPTHAEQARQRVNATQRLAVNYLVATGENYSLTILNNLTFAGVANKTQIKLLGISVTSDATAANHSFVRIRRNNPLTGPMVFNAVSALNSCVSVDTAATGGFTAGTTEFAYGVPGQSGVPIDLSDKGLLLQPGESYTITITPTSNQITDVQFRWEEQN